MFQTMQIPHLPASAALTSIARRAKVMMPGSETVEGLVLSVELFDLRLPRLAIPTRVHSNSRLRALLRSPTHEDHAKHNARVRVVYGFIVRSA